MRFRADDGSEFPDWEEKKLGDIATIVMGQSPDSKNYSEDPIGEVLVQGNADLKNGKVSPRIWTTESPKSAEPGSLLMTVRAPVGALAITDIPVALGRGVCAITGPEILYYQLAQVENNHYWDRVSAGSTFTAIDSNSIRALKLCCPSESEQKKITSLLSSVDETLLLCQRKLDLLTQAKKALIYNLFPRKGESEPRIRLAGFSGAWALEHVGSFLQESFEKGHTGEKARRLTVKLWGKGIEPKNSPFTGSSNTQYYVRHAGQLMYGKLDFLHAAFGIVPSELDGWESTLDSPAFDVKDANPYFLLYIFLQPEFYLHHGQIANGSRKAKRIHPALFFQMPIRIPSRDEQDAIVELLSSADALVDQARVELEQWREVKKSLLQQLFV